MMKEVFDRVKTHLLAQGARARNDVGLCLFHAPSGLKCAVGCLITEAAYSDEALEGYSLGEAEVSTALEASGIVVDPSTLDMLRDLQHIHDSESPANWERELSHLEAELFGDTK